MLIALIRYMLVLFFGVSILSACKAQQAKPIELPKQADGQTLLWQVTGKDVKKATYLFGTFHLMCKQDVQFSEPGGAGHLLGTYRMGDDPATSVTDSYGRTHDHPNLFLAGGGLFPTVGTANPTLTIVALALRAAEQIGADLGLQVEATPVASPVA